MSSAVRRAEKQREWEAEQERQDAERRRVASLTFYERIHESDASSDVKEMLRILADKAGILYEAEQ